MQLTGFLYVKMYSTINYIEIVWGNYPNVSLNACNKKPVLEVLYVLL